MDTLSPYIHSSFSSALLRLLSYASRPPYLPLSLIMTLARYLPMDAQRFDPMRRKVGSYHHHSLPRGSFLLSEDSF